MITTEETTIAIELPTRLARWLAENIQCQYAMEQENGGEGEGGEMCEILSTIYSSIATALEQPVRE